MSTPVPVPVPADADLRGFPFYPIEVARLRDSDLAAASPEVFRCAVLSWCTSWHQLPAGSLPNDDAALARLMGFGRDVRGWKKVRAAGGMRGWVLAADGRLYHPVVADKVHSALGGQRKKKDQTEAARKARLKAQHEAQQTLLQRSVTGSVTDIVTSSKREGEGERDGKGEGQSGVTTWPDEASGADGQTDSTPPADPEQAWRMERLEPWAQALKPILGNKLGPTTWQAWKRLVLKFTASRVLLVLEAMAPDKRWPPETEMELLEVVPQQAPAPRSASEDRAKVLVRQHGLAGIKALLPKCPINNEIEAIEALTLNPALADQVERGAA